MINPSAASISSNLPIPYGHIIIIWALLRRRVIGLLIRDADTGSLAVLLLISNIALPVLLSADTSLYIFNPVPALSVEALAVPLPPLVGDLPAHQAVRVDDAVGRPGLVVGLGRVGLVLPLAVLLVQGGKVDGDDGSPLVLLPGAFHLYFAVNQKLLGRVLRLRDDVRDFDAEFTRKKLTGLARSGRTPRSGPRSRSKRCSARPASSRP
jgi:hypothetical protein